MSRKTATQVVRFRQVRRDRAIASSGHARDLHVAAARERALQRCVDGFHELIRFTGKHFCVWCGELA